MTQSLIVAPVDLVLKGENENKPDYAMLIGVVPVIEQVAV